MIAPRMIAAGAKRNQFSASDFVMTEVCASSNWTGGAFEGFSSAKPKASAGVAMASSFVAAAPRNATAAAQHPDLGDGYAAALVNFGYIASGVLTTTEALDHLK